MSGNLDSGGGGSSGGVSPWRYISINGRSVDVRWVALFSSITGGIALSFFEGVVGAITAVGDAGVLVLERWTAGITTLIETVVGADSQFATAWESATETVVGSGVFGFLAGIAIVAGAWIVLSWGVSRVGGQ